jgi:hypothetical protein
VTPAAALAQVSFASVATSVVLSGRRTVSEPLPRQQIFSAPAFRMSMRSSVLMLMAWSC